MIILISGSSDISLDDVDTAATIVKNAADIDANIIFGVATDPELDDEMIVTVIATGFGTDSKPAAAPAAKQPAQEQAPAAEPKADDNGLDDDVIDIFNMFKNK